MLQLKGAGYSLFIVLIEKLLDVCYLLRMNGLSATSRNSLQIVLFSEYIMQYFSVIYQRRRALLEIGFKSLRIFE
tara:strand:+ start:340 stop:564 length:225 start_codon:yes stop_codon:yes gene_type:complete